MRDQAVLGQNNWDLQNFSRYAIIYLKLVNFIFGPKPELETKTKLNKAEAFRPKIWAQSFVAKTKAMNPYVYSRGRKAMDVPVLEDPKLSLAELLSSAVKAVCNISISPAIAIAMVVFAAGAVGSMSLIAYTESQGDFAPLGHNTPQHARVLGVATFGYNQPVCGYNTANCLNYELMGFSGNGWQARIDYQLMPGLTGAIRVNSWPFMDNITDSGFGYTGYDLLPGRTYNFILYKKVGRYLYRLTNLRITAPLQQPPQPSCPPQLTPPPYCYYDNSNQCGGNLVCTPPPPPPSYGYTSKDFSTGPGTLVQGWLETLSGYPTAPGKVAINGWAYANGADLNVKASLVNTVTGAVYSPDSISYSAYRSDVLGYITQKLGQQPGFQNGMFYLSFSNLPAGTYYFTGTYGSGGAFGGFAFNVLSQVPPTVYIGQTSPSYGYSGTLSVGNDTSHPYAATVTAGSTGNNLFGFVLANVPSNPATSYTYSISSVTLEGSSQQTGQNLSNSYLVDDNDIVVANSANTATAGSSLLYVFNPNFQIPSGASRTLRLRASVAASAVGSFSFRVISFGFPPNVSYPANISGQGSWWSNSVSIIPGPAATAPRVGQLINKNSLILFVGNNGVYGIPDLATFNSWGWSFNNVLPANAAEIALPQVGLVPFKLPGCNSPLDQINGTCGGAVSSLTVSLAPENPPSTTVLSGTPGVVFAVFNFAAGSAPVTITTLTLHRSGLGSDSHISSVYLSNGSQVLYFAGGLQNGAATFGGNGSTLFTIPANSTLKLIVKADLNASATAGSTEAFGFNSSADIVTSGASVTGSFPLVGNLVTIATTVGLSQLTVSATDIGVQGYNLNSTGDVVGKFNLQASNGDGVVKSLTLTLLGSAPSAAFANLKLFIDGVQVGGTLAGVSVTQSNHSLATFDFSASPIVIAAGSIRQLQLLADIISGAGSNFNFSIVYNTDIAVYDKVSNARISVNGGAAVIAVAQSSPLNITNAVTGTAPRVGQLINKNSLILFVGNNGVYGIPDLATFNSWGWSFNNVLPANAAEAALPQIGQVPYKLSGCNTPLDQINGTCGSTTALPDYTIALGFDHLDQILAGSLPVTKGQASVFKFKVTNLGANANTPSVEVQYGGIIPTSINANVPDNSCASQVWLGPNQSCVYAFSAIYNQAGSAYMTAVVNSRQSVPESNPNNNSVLLPITVQDSTVGASHAAGTNISDASGTVYLIASDGTRRPYASSDAFLSYGFNTFAAVVTGNSADLALPPGAAIFPSNGKVYCPSGSFDASVCYLMTAGQKAAFGSAQVFTAQGYRIATADASGAPSADNIVSSNEAHRPGTLVNVLGTIYLVGPGGTLRGIPDLATFNSWGWTFADVVTANAADALFSQGPMLVARMPGQLNP